MLLKWVDVNDDQKWAACVLLKSRCKQRSEVGGLRAAKKVDVNDDHK